MNTLRYVLKGVVTTLNTLRHVYQGLLQFEYFEICVNKNGFSHGSHMQGCFITKSNPHRK